jgi:hypothetical protein
MEANDNVGVALCGAPLKESILSKTHYGLKIYSHVLRLYYPDEVVMRLVERDCGLCRNPFNINKKTLHVFVVTENGLGNSFDKELARRDSVFAIPAGDAFGFAELHYKQQGDELLQTLNREMFLRIGEEKNFYPKRKAFVMTEKPLQVFSPADPKSPPLGDLGGCLFSFFKAPVSNTKPHKAVGVLDTYNYIVGKYAKERTEKLQAISDVAQAQKYKAANFDYCTFSGVFTTRNDKALIKHSGLLCIDFDHLQKVDTLRNQLLQDEYFDTQFLFVSPSGNGLKWIIAIDTTTTTHGDYFAAVANYVLQTCGIAVDKSGRDISRACFLPHDPQAFINPVYLKQI